MGGLFAGMVRARVFADRWTDLLPKIHNHRRFASKFHSKPLLRIRTSLLLMHLAFVVDLIILFESRYQFVVPQVPSHPKCFRTPNVDSYRTPLSRSLQSGNYREQVCGAHCSTQEKIHLPPSPSPFAKFAKRYGSTGFLP